jgi:hypothetical protein
LSWYAKLLEHENFYKTPKFVKQGQIWNDFKENDSGAKLYITSKFVTLWSFVVHVFNAMQQKARKGKSHVFA